MKTFKCTQPQSLRDFTDSTYPQGSFCLARLLRSRDVKVNGLRVGANVSLNPGDVVVYYTTPSQEGAPTHAVIYEDEHILVADKFSGVSTEGLCSELNWRSPHYAVHRLDRNTCGLIMFAKTEQAKGSLLSAFKLRQIKKTYIAVCKDNFKTDKQVLTAYLLKNEHNSTVKIYDTLVNGGVKITTEYSLADRLNGLALVTITLHTGKTHQIRAHMAHIGCPVLGDGKYGDGALNRQFNLTRQQLAAKRLQLGGLSGDMGYLNGAVFQSAFSFSLQQIFERRKKV